MPSRAQRIANAQQAGKIAPAPSQPTPNAAPAAAAMQLPASQQPALPVAPAASAAQTYQVPASAELRPANAPKISYSGGHLKIIADNSSLADILNALQTTTGAKLEGSQPDAERVFGQFGPGSPRQVLDALLAGSRYDFILLGSIEDPSNVQRIVLSPHSSAAGGGSAPGAQQAYRPPTPTPQTDDDDNDSFVSPQPIAQPVQPPDTSAQPNPNQQPGSPQVRTPEQLLQELQRMRQQQQQQQPQQQPPQPR
jgi:hypothetical protein